MFDVFFILFFYVIIIIQTSIGVGILVLGTPFLLYFNFNMVEILFLLLPISIITSLVNVILISSSEKKIKKISQEELLKFFIICIPSILVGVVILKFFQDYINFKILVSLIIFISIIVVTFNEKVKFKINFFRKTILSFVGILHGLTNSGGTLLSLVISLNTNKMNARFNITFFYFLLASTQYIITIFFFIDEFKFLNDINLIYVIIIGIITGNLLSRIVSEKKFKFIIKILATVSAFFLLINNN